ncbi:vacuolar protein-sorting-associated protein 25-like [Liolophura sinensis]|uniref:vacuolar protein-sorting-associated protein 25-like n=1 Tax=Liolophura sinensis TaxID=3198878 RepID=UPI00315835D5
MANITWPWQYDFPPFFTIQPNSDTRKKQLEAWCSLVLNYHKQRKVYSLDVNEAQDSPLFHNKKISRKLSSDGINIVLEELLKSGHLEWQDKSRKKCLIMWRTPEEWGSLIYKWASDNNMTGSVCTLFEITKGEDSSNQEFHGLEEWLLLRALKTLEVDRKAELMGNEGVKFF